MLNDIYPRHQLLDFRLGAHPPPPHQWSVPQPPADSDTEERDMDTDLPSYFRPTPNFGSSWFSKGWTLSLETSSSYTLSFNFSTAEYRSTTWAYRWTAHPPSLFKLRPGQFIFIALVLSFVFSHIHFILYLYMCVLIFIFCVWITLWFFNDFDDELLYVILMMVDYMWVDWWFVGVIDLINLFHHIWKCFNIELYLRISPILKGDSAEISAHIIMGNLFINFVL